MSKIDNLSRYKRPIREAKFSREEESAIWDFYVTKSISRSASQHRTVEDYRPAQFGQTRISLEWLLKRANVDESHCEIVHGQNMNIKLEQLGLLTSSNGVNDFTVPRIACLIPFGDDTVSSRDAIVSLMAHARNALAHGNTYFFYNDFVMLEDIGKNKVITARLLFHKYTLLNWIRYFDQGYKFYPEIKI